MIGHVCALSYCAHRVFSFIIHCIHPFSLQVKSAEAEAEAKYLSGVGVAKQRKAIVDGLRSSIVVSIVVCEGSITSLDSI